MSKIPAISVLDLVTLRASQTHREAMMHAIDLARHVDRLAYKRIWYAEHHNVDLFTCFSPAVMIAQIVSATERIRVGAGGVMLLNHSPLIVAEQFGTLEAFHPGRIDLGLGRANGSSVSQTELMNRALRRDPGTTPDSFSESLAELRSFIGSPRKDQEVKAGPAQDAAIPLFILGSSSAGAQLAGELGLPFTFAAHIAPDRLGEALVIYRQHFRPSEVLAEPHVIISVPAVGAETDQAASRCFTSMQQMYLASLRDMMQGTNSQHQLQPPVDSMEGIWSADEKQMLDRMLRCAVVGGRQTAANSIHKLLQETQADELMFLSETYDLADRLCSYMVLAEAVASLG